MHWLVKPERATRALLACAPSACVVFTALYIVAVFEDPEYAIFENYLSDLGVGPGAWAFNAGAIIGGCLLAFFAMGGVRSYFSDGMLMKGGSLLLAASGVFLVGVGMFTEDAGDVHVLTSYAFFISAFMSLAMLASGRLLLVGTIFDPFAFASASSFLVGMAVVFAAGAKPLAETMAVFTLLAWGLLTPVTVVLNGAHGNAA